MAKNDTPVRQGDAQKALVRIEHAALSIAESETAHREVRLFFSFLREHELDFSDHAVNKYVDDLSGRLTRQEIAASTYALKTSILRSTLRGLLRRSQIELDGRTVLAVEHLLSRIPSVRRAASRSQVSPDDIPDAEATQSLIDAAEPTLALMIEFLALTGCRISEALSARHSTCSDRGRGLVAVRILGKGRKEREVLIPQQLYRRIRECFAGREYLFEHHQKPYSRVATTNRNRSLSMRVLGREFSAHSFRHRFATERIAATGKIRAVADYLGHSDPATTLRMYVHERLNDDELGLP